MATDRQARRRGQAMIELAMGMFALALVLSALFTIANYALKSMEVQRTIRADAGRSAMIATGSGFITRSGKDRVEVERFAEAYMTGSSTLKIEERVSMPGMGVLK